MAVVCINDLVDGFLAFDLRDILVCLGKPAVDATWRCRKVECAYGECLPELEALGESGQPISGARLLELSRGVTQIIWGDFEATLPEGKIIIRAIDSTLWEVTGPETVVELVRGRFKDVRDPPGTV